MKLLCNQKKKFVRIIIGNCETGKKNLLPPTKTISIENTSIEEIYKKIMEMINSNKEKEKK